MARPLLAALALAAVTALAFDVRVDHVRYATSLISWHEHPDYPEWEAEGVWTEYRKNVFIAPELLPPPAPADARTLVFISPGQQGTFGISGISSCITGQNAAWDDDFEMKDKVLPVSELSLTGKLLSSGKFVSGKTFFSVCFDPTFNWEITSDAKDKAERAFVKWFLKHGNSSSVQQIILIGASRGGALVARMAHRISVDPNWGKIPITLGLIDAVPNVEQDEFHTSGHPKCTNPLCGDSNKYARQAGLAEYYADSIIKPRIFHVLTGSPVVADFIAHAMSACNATDASFYKEQWTCLSHFQICRCVDSEGASYVPKYLEQGVYPMVDWVLSQVN